MTVYPYGRLLHSKSNHYHVNVLHLIGVLATESLPKIFNFHVLLRPN